MSPAAPGDGLPRGPDKTPRRGLRVLVVDDNEDTAHGMARLLRLTGHTVWVAHNGPDALARGREHTPEVVVLDIGLPGMDGYEVADLLRKEDCCESAVIIAVSGYGQEQARGRSGAAGFDHHLVKPVDFEELLAVMKQAEPRP